LHGRTWLEPVYQDVAALRIWDAVQFALPPLRKVIEQELADEY
jgi:hypothetical protein